ncbi:MAG: dipeptidase PepE [Gemmatimonadetes bacterium]|nr:dipeptidase PepE [Gemmatimonadota bacterium]MBT8478010.1 dipeptidase PepE [Gemmatimonadota bacterium]NNK49721.1 dipeptidase PepE [Gemmatimonadota bacterium]
MRDILLLSTSTVHGTRFLEYAEPDIQAFFAGRASILFVPFARPGGISHEAYTELARTRFGEMGIGLAGLHEFADPVAAVNASEGVFVGGGNTFVLLRVLYEAGVLEPLRQRALTGMPYMGSSAGSNLAGMTIGTTNDMPIVEPASFESLGLVPFNINPHYLDPDPGSTHMGETRETRIAEFHHFNSQPVLGLREGAMLRVEGDAARVMGRNGGRLFARQADPVEIEPGSDVSFLLKGALS